MSSPCVKKGVRLIKSKHMKPKIFIGLNEDDLLSIEQIVLDRDAEGALTFINGVLKKEIDRENNSKMKRAGS